MNPNFPLKKREAVVMQGSAQESLGEFLDFFFLLLTVWYFVLKRDLYLFFFVLNWIKSTEDWWPKMWKWHKSEQSKLRQMKKVKTICSVEEGCNGLNMFFLVYSYGFLVWGNMGL